MLAVIDKVLDTILIVWEPASWVHAAKIAVVQNRRDIWVGHPLIGVLAPIRDAFSVSFDGS